MARPRVPQPVKLICGLLGADPDLLRRARQRLVRRFGPTDAESEVWPFTQTNYYQDEMGPDLKRQFLAFARLVRADELGQIKLDTNALEAEIADECAGLDVTRPVNLDPGYIDLGKLILATAKDRSQRIYLSNGIFAEVTLQYADGSWQPLPWTYRDYQEPHYHAFFNRVRQTLYEQRQTLSHVQETLDAIAGPDLSPMNDPVADPIPFDETDFSTPRSP